MGARSERVWQIEMLQFRSYAVLTRICNKISESERNTLSLGGNNENNEDCRSDKGVTLLRRL